MRAKPKAHRIARKASDAGEPSRLAQTSLFFGTAACVIAILTVILALVASRFAGLIFLYGGPTAFSFGLAATISGYFTRSKIRQIAAGLDRLRIRKSPLRIKAERRSRAGIIAGCCGALSPLLALTLASAGVFRTDRVYNLNESRAIESLRTLNRANATYYRTCGHSFASRLSDLGPPETGKAANCQAAALIDAPLAWGTRQGYRIFYLARHRDDSGRVDAYIARADPVIRALAGKRSFYSDESQLIRSSAKGVATPEDEPIE